LKKGKIMETIVAPANTAAKDWTLKPVKKSDDVQVAFRGLDLGLFSGGAQTWDGGPEQIICAFQTPAMVALGVVQVEVNWSEAYDERVVDQSVMSGIERAAWALAESLDDEDRVPTREEAAGLVALVKSLEQDCAISRHELDALETSYEQAERQWDGE
jgi:hypothetical protein